MCVLGAQHNAALTSTSIRGCCTNNRTTTSPAGWIWGRHWLRDLRTPGRDRGRLLCREEDFPAPKGGISRLRPLWGIALGVLCMGLAGQEEKRSRCVGIQQPSPRVNAAAAAGPGGPHRCCLGCTVLIREINLLMLI